MSTYSKALAEINDWHTLFVLTTRAEQKREKSSVPVTRLMTYDTDCTVYGPIST